MKISLVAPTAEEGLLKAADALDLKESSRTDLAVLLALAKKSYTSTSALSKAIGSSDEDTFESLLRLKELGLVSLSAEKKKASHVTLPEPGPKKRKLSSAPELPTLSSAETAKLLESAPEIAKLMDAIEQTMGRMLNTAEKNNVFAMIDYLGLESDYILLLVSHCVSQNRGRCTMAQINRLALNLSESGIVTYHDLEEYLKRKDAAAAVDSKIRSLFGIGSRSLSKKEAETVERWTAEWHFSPEMIELARDTMVNSKGGLAKISYVNSILQDWHDKGYTKPEDVEGKKPLSGTFDTDQFFEEALKRSYQQ